MIEKAPETHMGVVIWRVLFDEDYIESSDINKPEHEPRKKALERKEIEEFKSFATTYGKPLFSQLQLDIRAGIYHLLANEHLPKDESLRILDQLRYLVKVTGNAHYMISKGIKDEATE